MKVTNTLAVAGLCAMASLLPSSTVFAAPVSAHRISAAQAEAAAVKKIPGKAVSAKYEFEDGHWQYAVLVKKGNALYEVEVNATNGKVLDTERTSMAEERSEAAADQRAAMRKHASH